MGLFDGIKSLGILEQGLDTAVARRDVISNNIANVDVPNFKRSEVSFEASMKRAIESEKVTSETKLQTLHPGHISGRTPQSWHNVKPEVHTDYMSTMRNDGNNVDIEDEMSKMVRNQMQYSLYVDRVGAQFRNWNSFIRLA